SDRELRSRRHFLPRLREDVAEHPRDLVELRLRRDQGRRDLDHRISAIVGAADQAAFEEPGREELTQEQLALVLGEGLARFPILHELERVEEPGPANVTDDRQLEELRKRRAEVVLRLRDMLDDLLAFHDLD